jgi:transcriptional regulator with XRE-family HTH domain
MMRRRWQPAGGMASHTPRLAKNIGEAIDQSGKSGREIAEAVKVHEANISQLRNGKRDNPTLRVLLAIARECRVTVSELLEGVK